jgi:hypothetical protein
MRRSWQVSLSYLEAWRKYRLWNSATRVEILNPWNYLRQSEDRGFGFIEFRSMNPSYSETGGLVLTLFFGMCQDRSQKRKQRDWRRAWGRLPMEGDVDCKPVSVVSFWISSPRQAERVFRELDARPVRVERVCRSSARRVCGNVGWHVLLIDRPHD